MDICGISLVIVYLIICYFLIYILVNWSGQKWMPSNQLIIKNNIKLFDISVKVGAENSNQTKVIEKNKMLVGIWKFRESWLYEGMK